MWKIENGKHVSGWLEVYKCTKCEYIHHEQLTVCRKCGEKDTLRGIVAREVETNSLWDFCFHTSRHWEEKQEVE